MAAFARVEGGVVVQVLRAANGVAPPGYQPLTILKPAYNPVIETLTGPEFFIYPDGVEAVWTVELVSGALARAKAYQSRKIKEEALRRIQAVYPAVIDFEWLALVRDMMLSVVPAARDLVPDITTVTQIYQAGRAALATIDGMTDPYAVMAYNPSTDPNWP